MGSGSGAASARPGVSTHSVQMPEERRHLGRPVLGGKMTRKRETDAFSPGILGETDGEVKTKPLQAA